MALKLLTRGTTVLRDFAAPAEVIVGSAGVIVVLAEEDGDRAELRAHVGAVRAVLDAAGLSSFTTDGILCTSSCTGHPLRREDGLFVGDLDAVNLALLLTSESRCYGPGTMIRAVAALAPALPVAPPPWVATVKEPETAPAPAPAPMRSASKRV